MKSEIIAEIGSNWEGDLNIAKKIIKKCKQAGANGVDRKSTRLNSSHT